MANHTTHQHCSVCGVCCLDDVCAAGVVDHKRAALLPTRLRGTFPPLRHPITRSG